MISNPRRGGRRHLPYAFNEQGIAMLSSILRSKRAVQVNIRIVRAFVRMRELLASNRELSLRVDRLESRQKTHSKHILYLAGEIEQLKLPAPAGPKRRIGYPTKPTTEDD